MAMAEPIRQSNSLPSLSYLDLEKIKKESSAFAHKIPISTSLNMSAAPLASPSIYSGPPPPYSYPSSAASSVVGVNTGNNGYISPPDSRHPSDHEKEAAQPPRLHSLPSIHEALGNDQHISINSLLSKSAAVTQAPPPSHRSPTSPVSRSHPDTPTRPPLSFTQPPLPASYRSQDHSEQVKPRYSPQLPKDLASPQFQPPSSHRYPPSQPNRTACSPVEAPRSTAHAMPTLRQASPGNYEYSRTSTAGHQYTYSPYHPAYSYPMQPPSIPSHQAPPLQPPPSTWRVVGSDLERAEEARKAAVKTSPMLPCYGEKVKRHLDRFDLETSLNEIAEGSGRALTFSREYGEKAHNAQRTDLPPESTPTLAECDEMIKQQRGVLASMERIREVILKQQQDLAEQRNRSQNFKATSDYDEDSVYGDKLDGIGGFAGADAKKRKGRAAPPGRCHSCNRAETPEWRRGPDGARTLCNACGLHYAKLTRKMGSKPSTGGSNLRPKESSPP